VNQNLVLHGQGIGNQGALWNEQGTNTVSGTVTSTDFSFIGVGGTNPDGNIGTSSLTLNSLVGFGLVKVGTDALLLPNNDAHYSGPTTVLGGTLVVGAPNALGGSGSDDTIVDGGATLKVNRAVAVGAALTLGDGATLQLAGGNWSGAIALAGNIQVDVPSGSATISGDISGIDGAGLSVFGSLTLSGFDTYNGSTVVNLGAMHVLGFLGYSPVTLAQGVGATLEGGPQAVLGSLAAASTNAVVIGNGATVAGTVDLEVGSSFDVTLGPSSPASALIVSGGVVGVSGKLRLALAPGFKPAVGKQFTLIENDTGLPVLGVFANWADGSIQTIGGVKFQISYGVRNAGGNVVLTVVA
jgi:autotransporter-associated beta strand protein